ncbi:hypothetical protein SUGI_0636490 [Cryptomeria japonica]|nr:hypothetical protein SUGI_0636490 [Cryptomeria japonica]
MGGFGFVQSCFKLPARNDVFPEEEQQDGNAKKMKRKSKDSSHDKKNGPIVVSKFPLGSNLSCFKLPARNDVFPEEEQQDGNAKKMKRKSKDSSHDKKNGPIVVSKFPLGSNLVGVYVN